MKQFNIILAMIFAFAIFSNGEIYSQKKPATPKNAKSKPEKKQEPVKEDSKLDLVERIRLVFKFGNASQVKDSLEKVKTLKETEQKSLIPEMKILLNVTDVSIQRAIIQTIADVKWNDLDDSIIKFLDSEDNLIVTTTANAARKKNVRQAIVPIIKRLKSIDYTAPDTHVNDLINAYAGFKDSTLKDFMFEKLRDEKVMENYKVFMVKYLGNLDDAQLEIKKYLLDVTNDEKENINLRLYAVRALGNMKYMEAREPFRKNLKSIDALTDNDKKREVFPLRLELISSLVKLDDPDVKLLLIQMTRDDDELVRVRAIRKLSEFKSKEFIDLLEYKIKYDTSASVQKAAKKALEEIRGKSTSPNDDGP